MARRSPNIQAKSSPTTVTRKDPLVSGRIEHVPFDNADDEIAPFAGPKPEVEDGAAAARSRGFSLSIFRLPAGSVIATALPTDQFKIGTFACTNLRSIIATSSASTAPPRASAILRHG
jgi:hypothetical protein